MEWLLKVSCGLCNETHIYEIIMTLGTNANPPLRTMARRSSLRQSQWPPGPFKLTHFKAEFILLKTT
jgi:hypothetical protein